MTQEEKQLLIKDLCARLPYGINVLVSSLHTTDSVRKKLNANLLFGLQKSVLTIKPYLRPIHKLTKEELEELEFLTDSDYVDYCNEHHIDYRNLIPKGLALEAPEDMYKK